MRPRHLLVAAAALLLVLGVLELAGGRASTTVVAGMSAATGDAFIGLAYAIVWFIAVLLAPPLVLAAALLSATRHRLSRRTPAPHGEQATSSYEPQ